jgi:hypothetical protein
MAPNPILLFYYTREAGAKVKGQREKGKGKA